MTDLTLDRWMEAVDAFPITGTHLQKAEAAVRYAVMAPSSHNTQPWLFRVTDRTIELFADRSRALPVADPDDRELVISCGAALYTLRLALGFFGIATAADLLPDPDDPDLLATVRFTGEREPTPRERDLFREVPRRRTNRFAFEDRPIPDPLRAALEDVALGEGAALTFVDDEEARGWLADLIAAADRRQMADRRFRRELAAWCRTNLSRRRDGIPGRGLGLGTVASIGAPLVLRTFDMGDGRAARDRELALGSPVLAVLATEDDAPAALLRAGQALAGVLLLARAGGVSASFLNQPLEVDELRPEVERLGEIPGRAQIILRMGFGPDVPPPPRRPLEEVLLR